MDSSALAVAIGDLVAVVAYLFLGSVFSVRKVAAESQIPMLQFSAFWFLLGLTTFLSGVESLSAIAATPPLVLVVTFYRLQLFALCGALWGLVGYLLFLYTGRSYLFPLSAMYLALYGLLLYYVSASKATAVTVTYGAVGLQYSTTPSGTGLAILLVLLVVPEFLAAILYFTLFFRSRDPTVRYRIALVSWGLLGFFGVGALDLAARLGGGLAAVSLGAAVSLIPVAVILLAYYPPQVVRHRFGVAPITTVTRSPTRP